ncbi:MAG: hypothetical protein WCJ03_10340 [Bacteroidales bacterium]
MAHYLNYLMRTAQMSEEKTHECASVGNEYFEKAYNRYRERNRTFDNLYTTSRSTNYRQNIY